MINKLRISHTRLTRGYLMPLQGTFDDILICGVSNIFSQKPNRMWHISQSKELKQIIR